MGTVALTVVSSAMVVPNSKYFILFTFTIWEYYGSEIARIFLFTSAIWELAPFSGLKMKGGGRGGGL